MSNLFKVNPSPHQKINKNKYTLKTQLIWKEWGSEIRLVIEWANSTGKAK